jgi:hypothetical protein
VGDGSNTLKGDDSLRSFLFTLRNPHDIPPRKFVLRAERKQHAIYCDSGHGPAFGRTDSWSDICVYDNCNRNRDSYTHIGTRHGDRMYANDTSFEYFFTGALNFIVNEIEVFEIADYTTLPADVEKCANGRLFQERVRDARAGSAGRVRETQTGDSASGKATNARGGCSWRMSSRSSRGQERIFRCRMCSREEDERLVEVEGGARGSWEKRTNKGSKNGFRWDNHRIIV